MKNSSTIPIDIFNREAKSLTLFRRNQVAIPSMGSHKKPITHPKEKETPTRVRGRSAVTQDSPPAILKCAFQCWKMIVGSHPRTRKGMMLRINIVNRLVNKYRTRTEDDSWVRYRKTTGKRGKAIGLKEIAIPNRIAERIYFFSSRSRYEEMNNNVTMGSIWPQAEVVSKRKGLNRRKIWAVRIDFGLEFRRRNIFPTRRTRAILAAMIGSLIARLYKKILGTIL
jgi:hypothetical protein